MRTSEKPDNRFQKKKKHCGTESVQHSYKKKRTIIKKYTHEAKGLQLSFQTLDLHHTQKTGKKKSYLRQRRTRQRSKKKKTHDL